MQRKRISSRVLVLLSGGIDSAAATHLLKKDHLVDGLFADYGQAAREIERRASHAVADLLDITVTRASIATAKTFATGEIPARNGLLAMLALSVAGNDYDAIAMGIHAGTPYYDCSPAFADRLDVIIREYSNGQTRFSTPFLHWRKSEIYQYCRMANLDLSVTYSCEAGTCPPCGKCLSCLDRAHFDASQDTEADAEKWGRNSNAPSSTILLKQGSSERKRR